MTLDITKFHWIAGGAGVVWAVAVKPARVSTSSAFGRVSLDPIVAAYRCAAYQALPQLCRGAVYSSKFVLEKVDLGE